MLWDTGVDGALAGKPAASEWVFTIGLKQRLVAQLARVGIKPADVNFVGISHYHDDHTGQAADFPGATLLMGSSDWEVVKTRPDTAKRFTPWISGGAKVDAVARDKDVFGDQSVVILDMPGHSPGHKALLVRLKSGPVLLTGDLYHATEQVVNRGVPSFNTNRADTLASFDRFQAIARNLKAKVIIQHEPADIAKLPAFPRAAE
jgi:glyoxylase-like metal-dependent hydrolase (beta-lactamase superfamily II)